MSTRYNSKQAFYQTADPDSKSYAITCASGTTAYADFDPGYYDCFSPDAAAGKHFRWKYLDMPDPTSPPTAAANTIDAPVAGTSAQAAGEAQAIAPANGLIRLFVQEDKRLAILYSEAGAVTLYCTKVYS